MDRPGAVRTPRHGSATQICAVCCGTKRLVEIECPADCVYLAAAREHPAAPVVRQQQHDMERLAHTMRDLNDRQAQLFFLVATFLVRYEPPDLQTYVDQDVMEAAGALAATFETAVRGVIYQQRPAALPAARLVAALKPILAEASKRVGSAFDRDAALVFRRVEEAAREADAADASRRRAYLGFLARVLPKASGGPAADADRGPQLIVP